MSKGKSKLIHTWTEGGVQYRIVAHGKYSQDYEDRITISYLGQDDLGDPTWKVVAEHEFRDDDNTLMCKLVALLFSAVKSKSSSAP